ncbi:unnamed protein product [Calicophoron daubneyi]|uniref:Ion transport domain-containing protein n=1 Tax=Calicophoron daubneyi TaxID=300641 RepID=A0AAV2TVR3_CALDB
MLENTPQCPIDGFIRDMPTMCGLVLDQYIKEIGSVNSTDHEIVYDFTILQRPVSANEPPQKDPMRRMKLMVELQRGELLVHPLCTAYLERKWTAYGRWVQLITTTYFAILMAGITSLVVSHNPIRHVETLDRIARCSDLIYTSPKKLYMITVVAAVVLALTCADISIKLWQLFSQRLEYFKEMNNYLEFLLSLLALVYSALTLAGHITHQHSGLGVVVMFLAWFNFLLQMMRFGHVGIFVVMFLNVFATVGKCLIVFSLVFVAFALSFHVLFRIPEYKDFVKLTAEDRAKVEDCFTAHRRFSAMAPNNTENTNVAMELQSFQYIGLSLFKTLMMMLGEYEHTATVIEPLIGDSPITLNFPIITLLLYVAFVFLLPIIIMNLLIGLAVGDIDNVRKSAVHRLISQQVYWLAELEPKLMMVCHAKLYQPYWKRRTKRASASLGMNEKVAEVETGEQTTTYSVLRDLSQHVESVNYQIKLQTVRMAAVVEKLEVKTNEYTLDEGVYPGVLLGANEHSGKQKRKS